MILDSDWLLFDIAHVLIHSTQLGSVITSDQGNPSKLESFKSYRKTSSKNAKAQFSRNVKRFNNVPRAQKKPYNGFAIALKRFQF